MTDRPDWNQFQQEMAQLQREIEERQRRRREVLEPLLRRIERELGDDKDRQ